jgi:hypothetical protein
VITGTGPGQAGAGPMPAGPGRGRARPNRRRTLRIGANRDAIASVDELSFQVDRQSPVTVIRIAGHLRLESVPRVRGTLLKCLAECPAGVVVDLAALTVTQPIVLTVFPAVLDRATTWPAVPVVLAAPDEATAAALCHTAPSVPVRPTVESAIDAAAAGAPLGRLRLFLEPTRLAPAEARRFTRDACAAWDLDAVVDEATVIVTELADNAVRHARTEFEVTLSYRGIYLNIAVHDGEPQPAREHTPAGGAGRGLRLVDAFATAWGTLPTADGKATWATIRVR